MFCIFSKKKQHHSIDPLPTSPNPTHPISKILGSWHIEMPINHSSIFKHFSASTFEGGKSYRSTAFGILSSHRIYWTGILAYFSLHVCLIFMGKCRYTLLYYISYIDPKVFLSQHFKLEWFVQRFHGIFCRTWMHKTLNHYGKRLYNTISFLLCKIRKNKNKQYSLLYNYRNLAAYRSFTNLCAVRLRENTRFSLPNSQCGRTTCPLPLQSSFSSATGHLYGLLMHGSFNQKTSVEEIERTYAMRCSSRLVLNSSTEGKLALATAYVAFPKCSLFTKPWLI